MHHSTDPRRISLAVTCYCDDSGSHDDSSTAVVGGTVMNKQGFIDLDHDWRRLLREFRLENIHMKDFTRPYGRYCTMNREMKIALFTSVANIINKTKVYSVSIAVPNSDFRALFPPKVYSQFMGGYALAFFALVIANHDIALVTHYNNRISYLIDKGSNHHHQQLEGAHSVMLRVEKENGEKFTGAMASDLDDNNNALQAADVIAWTYHRSLESEVGEEFRPLLKIFLEKQPPPRNKRPHLALAIPPEGVTIFANYIKSWIERTGQIPSWPEVEHLIGSASRRR